MSKNKECVDIMIDIQTLGKSPGSIILSIGAVNFDIEKDEILGEFYAVIDLESSIHNGLTVDSSTLLWWMSDDQQEARNNILKAYEDEDEDVYDLCEALVDISDFIESGREKNKDLRVWANPPTFDLMILESAFDVMYMEIPWKHYEMMDFRTLKNLYKEKKPKFDIEGIKHNALYDAKLQAQICSHIWKWIKEISGE